jgi:hypothetical protein
MTTETTSPMLTSTRSLCGTTPADVIGAQEEHALRIAAAQAANAHAFVCELPEGYYTPIGDRGVVLTDSQQLRLRIAGLLAADPPAVVLDDPTAGLSAAGEAAVKPGLRMLVRGRDVSSIGMSREVIPSISDATAGPEVSVPGDHALPALGSLLDPRHMEVLLARSLNEYHVDVRLHSVRYKPGDNVVVQYSVLTQSGWATAVAYSRARGKLKRKRSTPSNRRLARRVTDQVPGDKAAFYLPDVSALVQWLPLDLRLPVLADSAHWLGARLEKKEVVPGRVEIEVGVLRVERA